MARIGMRNFKTSISVFICILVLEYTEIANPFFACITAILVIKTDMHTSFKAGADRLIGTIFGSLIGSLSAIIFYKFLPMDILLVRSLVIPLGVMLIIYILTSLKLKDAVLISCVVFLAIMITMESEAELLSYAFERIISTVFGAVVALLVNRFIYPHRVINKKKKKKNI